MERGRDGNDCSRGTQYLFKVTNILELCSGDGPTRLQMNLLTLNYTLKNDQRENFYGFQWDTKNVKLLHVEEIKDDSGNLPKFCHILIQDLNSLYLTLQTQT